MDRAKWVEQEAARARERSGQKIPPVDPEAVARVQAIPVRRGVVLPTGVRASWSEGAAEITLAAGLTPQLERFPLAHEIGHAVLGHGACDGVGEPAATDFPLDEADMGIDYEREASLFAQCLLLPREWVRRDVLAGIGQAALLDRYGVAKSTLQIAVTRYRLFSKLKP